MAPIAVGINALRSRGRPITAASTPEAQGIASQAVLDFVAAADSSVTMIDSFMIVRHGMVTKTTGQTALDYLKPRVFAPLGMENPRWDSSSEGNSLGGYGLYLRTEELAKFGQLILQKGNWNGKQLISREWIEEATSKQIANEREDHAKIGADWKEVSNFGDVVITPSAPTGQEDSSSS